MPGNTLLWESLLLKNYRANIGRNEQTCGSIFEAKVVTLEYEQGKAIRHFYPARYDRSGARGGVSKSFPPEEAPATTVPYPAFCFP
jgi:hypothetical protein